MLKDVQSEKDYRNISINKIGICDYKLPITLLIGEQKYSSICNISSNVSLDENHRGAHLSRIIETINNNIYGKEISLFDVSKIVQELINRSETIGGMIYLDFDIIIKRYTPITKKESFSTVNLKVSNTVTNGINQKSLTISLWGTSLCPCSKEIAKYGAHSQKCKVMITLYGNYENINLLNFIQVIEKQFSANVFSTLKREDEKYVTELAYENPKFSEDLIRDLLIGVSEMYNDQIDAELINYESIHEHNVYAKGTIYSKKKRKW